VAGQELGDALPQPVRADGVAQFSGPPAT
jgi:hypothetical protein